MEVRAADADELLLRSLSRCPSGCRTATTRAVRAASCSTSSIVKTPASPCVLLSLLLLRPSPLSLQPADALPQQARCPVCSAGPLSERELAALQHADGSRPSGSNGSQVNKGKGKKAAYTVETVSTSSPGSTASTREVLTLLDSDDEEGEKTPSPKKKKEKAVVQITLDSSSDEGSGDEDGDEYEPSPPPRSARVDEDDDEDDDVKMGVLDSGDDSDADGPSTRSALASTDFRSSTKLDALVKSLAAAKAKDPGLKAVVFSQVRSGSLSTPPLSLSFAQARLTLRSPCSSPASSTSSSAS